MSRIESIESKVRELTSEELAEFRAWFERFDNEAWDRQFEDDAQRGHLDKIADKALGEHADGKSSEL